MNIENLSTLTNSKRTLIKNSASFFSILFLTVGIIFLSSCKKKEYNNGSNSINGAYDVNSALQEEYDLTTYTIKEDSIRCKNPSHTLFGSYLDPTFGLFKSSIYSNFILENPGPTNFTSSQTIDSVVLSLQFNGYYGTPGKLNISVHELTDAIPTEDTIYQFQTVSHSTEDLVEGSNLIKLAPNTKAVVGSDTLSAQLRIKLKNSFGQHLIDGVEQGHYETQAAFKEFFKGLHIVTDDILPFGEGAIYYFNMTAVNSCITIYYKDDENNKKSFKYIVNKKDAIFFNHVEKDFTNTKIEALLADSTKGLNEFYMQAYGLRSILKIPQFKNIPENAIIHQAQVILPYTSYYQDPLYPSGSVSIGYYDNDDFSKPITISKGNVYNPSLKAFVFDLNDYTNNIIVPQNIIDDILHTETFFIIPDNYANSSERTIFNGKNSAYKVKPKLKLIYTLN